MHTDLFPVIAATAQWLTRSFPASGGALASALCEAQARQAVTVAARLRYPSATDAALLSLLGPGGAARLDDVTGGGDEGAAWRTWVDEVVASWAAGLLADPELARLAVGLLDGDTPAGFRRLLTPDATDRRAAALLRHPDLLLPVSALHHAALLARLGSDTTLVA
ncbi:hypothetical protein ACIRPR_26145 [Streptomyces griseoflavus]|uniref:hypothetical protein n=1 Tax=Streptomyces griseoflavus TaxID=35619 RepID=UPI00382DB0F2